MRGRWTKHWVVAAALVAAGVTVACTRDDDPGPSGPSAVENESGSRPQTVSSPPELLSAACWPQGSNYTEDVKASCVEVWGDWYVDLNDPFRSTPQYQCKAWGHPPTNSGYESDNATVWTPTGQDRSLSHTFTITGHRNNDPYRSWMWVNATDPTRFKGEASGVFRPSNSNERATVTCTVDGVSATGYVEIWGDTPMLQQVIISAPRTAVTPGETVQLIANFKDSYGFTGDLYPVPTFTWSTSNANVATVSSSGLVTAISEGPVTISATPVAGSNVPSGFGPTGQPMTVTHCTQVTPSVPTKDLDYRGPTTHISETLTCPAGVLVSNQKLTWTATPNTIVTVTPDNSFPAQGATVNPDKDGGTATVTACTTSTVNQVCGTTTVRVARLKVTSGWEGTTVYMQPNSQRIIGFDVKNTGSATKTYSLWCSATGVVQCAAQAPSPLTGDLAGGAVRTVYIPINSTSLGSGKVFFAAGTYAVDTVNITVSYDTGLPLGVYPGPYTEVKPSTTCTWTATPTGGTTPYHYAWDIGGGAVGTDSPTLDMSFRRAGTYTLGVTVTDGANNSAYGTINVNVASNWGGCLQ